MADDFRPRDQWTLDEQLSEAQRLLRDGYNDDLSRAIANARDALADDGDRKQLTDAEADAFLAECPSADPERVARIRKLLDRALAARLLTDDAAVIEQAIRELRFEGSPTADDLAEAWEGARRMDDDDRKTLQSLAELLAAQAEATRAALGGVRDELNVLSAAVRALARRLGALERGRLTDARGTTHKGQG